MKNQNVIYLVVIGVLAFLLWKTGCGDSAGDGVEIVRSDTVRTVIHDTIPGDSIPYPVKEYVPTVEYKTLWLDKYIPVDTQEIVMDYLAKLFYTDTIVDDTARMVKIIINDSVHRNRISYRKVYVQNLKETAISTEITEVVTVKKFSWNKVFIGGEAGYLNGPTLQIGLMAQNKKDNIIGLSYDPFNQGIMVKYYAKIKLPRFMNKKTPRD